MADNEKTVNGLTVRVYNGDNKLTVDEAKKILGWQSSTGTGVDFENKYFLRDKEGDKVRLTNNVTNRPFRRGLADAYALEMLRKKWALNGETIVIDKKGGVQSGQHRLIALVFAEQMRSADKEKWKEYGWSGPVKIDAVVVSGIDTKKEVVDTLDLGQKRSLGDVIFRNQEFVATKESPLSEAEQKTLANVLSGAIRLSWIRQGGKVVSDAPKLPHSEALQHLEENPVIRDCVDFVWREDAGETGKRISSLIPLTYAAGLMYLMATSGTKQGKEIDLKMQSKAEEFWVKFASGADLKADDPILVLRKLLTNRSTSTGAGRDEVVILVVKAWNLWIDGNKATASDIKVKMAKNKDTGKMVVDEDPRMGGLDVVVEKPAKAEPAPKPAKKEAAKAATPKEPVTKVPGAGKVVKKKAAPKKRGAASIAVTEDAALPDFA